MTRPRWSRDSAQLQHFVARHLASHKPLAGAPQTTHHVHVARRVLALTDAWYRRPPQFAREERCTASVPSASPIGHLPTRMHVVKEMAEHHPGLLDTVRRDTLTKDMTNDALLSKIEARDYAWFHSHASDLLENLGNPVFVQRIANLAPTLQWCCRMWQRHPQLYGYFVPLDVQQRAECRARCTSRYLWRWKKRSYELAVLMPDMSLRPEIMQQMAFRISVTANLDEHSCGHVMLRWFPSDCRKEVTGAQDGSTSHSWTPLHVNTAATYPHSCNTITIWRQEESYKTATHEMLHAFGWDFEAALFPRAQADILGHFHMEPRTEIRIYESYVETWATLLNTYIVAAQEIPPCTPLRLQMVHARIDSLIRAETLFALFQCAKALHHCGFRTWLDFFRDGDSGEGNSCPRFAQTTSVFSYFIVRATHLFDLAWFVRTFPHVNFQNNGEIVWETWWSHLLDVWSSPSFAECIDYCLGLHRRHEAVMQEGGGNGANHDDTTRRAFKTMRMTLHEIA